MYVMRWAQSEGLAVRPGRYVYVDGMKLPPQEGWSCLTTTCERLDPVVLPFVDPVRGNAVQSRMRSDGSRTRIELFQTTLFFKAANRADSARCIWFSRLRHSLWRHDVVNEPSMSLASIVESKFEAYRG